MPDQNTAGTPAAEQRSHEGRTGSAYARQRKLVNPVRFKGMTDIEGSARAAQPGIEYVFGPFQAILLQAAVPTVAENLAERIVRLHLQPTTETAAGVHL